MRKKRLILSTLALALVFTLTACVKRLDAKEAGHILVNSYVYGKDEDKLKRYLNLEFDESDDVPRSIDKALNKELPKVTSYKVKMKKDDKINPIITVEVKGINEKIFQQDFEKNFMDGMIKYLESNGYPEIKTEEDLENLDEDAYDDVADLMKEYTDGDDAEKYIGDALISAVKSAKKSDKVNKFDIKLRADKNDKQAWEVVDSNQFEDDVAKAFGLDF